MKQKEEAETLEKLAAEQEAREKEAHWTLEVADADTETTMPLVIIEEGVSDNPMLGRAGRQSFGNFNPALERNAAPGKQEPGAMEDGEIEDVQLKDAGEKHPQSMIKQRSGDKKALGVKGGIFKRESKPSIHRRDFRKHRPYKPHSGPRFGRSN